MIIQTRPCMGNTAERKSRWIVKTLVPLSDGVEEIEAVVVVDTLRRAGWDVTSVSAGARTVNASRNVKLVADALWGEVDVSEYDLIVLPGGAENARTLASHAGVLEALRVFDASDRTVAAICAAPLVLQAAGILDGRKATCHPAVRKELTAAVYRDKPVVVDRNIVTSQGAGTAFEFALTLIREADGPGKAEQVAEAMVLNTDRWRIDN